jgi:hypothetical protein
MLRIDLAVQHALPPRHFFFLTNTALHTLVRDPICRAIIRSLSVRVSCELILFFFFWRAGNGQADRPALPNPGGERWASHAQY